MSEEFAHKKKLWIYTSVDPVAFSFVHLQLFFTRESVSLMLHLKKKILFSITAAIILGSMPLSGNAWEVEPEISGVSLQQIVQSTMAISGVSMQRIGINCRADFVLRILRSALMWMSKKQAKDLR